MAGLSRRGFLLTASGALACAQEATFSLNVDVVNVLASVRDKEGRFVSDLTGEDFTVEEDGRPQSIRYFERQSDLGVTLGLLVDISGSQAGFIDDERRASTKFFDQVLREDRDQAFLFRFYRRVELLSYLSHSRSDLKTALGRLKDPHEINLVASPKFQQPVARLDGTALYDAVLLPCDAIMSKLQGRKALILLSDGVSIRGAARLNRVRLKARNALTL